MVGAEYDTHHGLTNAIILPTVLRFNLPGMDEKVKRMNEAMQFEGNSAESFISNIEKLLDRINIPMVDTAFGTNPRNATYDEMLELVRTSIAQAR